MQQSGQAQSSFYTPLQRRLHWLVLLLVVLQYALQAPMKAALMAIDSHETLTFMQFLVTTMHSWGGLGIVAITLWRWQLRLHRVAPAAGQLSARVEWFVRAHHICLHAALVIMGMSGALHYYADIGMAERVHEWGKWLLLFLIGVHIAGALSHLTDDSRVLQRMLGRDSQR